MLGHHPLTEKTSHDMAIANMISEHLNMNNDSPNFYPLENTEEEQNEIGWGARIPPELDEVAKYQMFLGHNDNHANYNNEYYANLYRSWPIAYSHHTAADDIDEDTVSELYN